MKKLLSIVVPVYFEEEVIQHFIDKVTLELNKINYNYEIIFIDDGSKDTTIEIIEKNIIINSKIRLISFSYNHGKQAAVTAGVQFSKGDYLIYMDPDLQDPPEEIPRFINKIEEGFDLVFGVRKEKKDSFFNNLYSKLFWKLLRKYTGLNLPTNLAVMRIFNRKFADKFLDYKEQNRFIEGIFMHISMNFTQIQIEQHNRFAGKSKFNFKRKLDLAADAIFDFSEIPLKLAVKVGAGFITIGLILIFIIIILKVTFITFQAGWPSMVSVLIFGFGIQIFFTGLIAIYIGRIYKESKNRPLYSIKNLINVK